LEGFSRKKVFGLKPVILNVLPKDFNQVKFRAIRGNKLNVEPFFLPLFAFFFESLTAMGRGIV